MAIPYRTAAIGMAMVLGTAASASTAPLVRAPAGTVRGSAIDGERVFKGIPFAAPPVGKLRWAAPVPLAAWPGVRDATRFGAACMQVPYPAGSIYAEDFPAMSEDCLTLNVWAPANARKAPVFLWIHGGSLQRGSSQQTMFDGTALAKRGIVVVSVNYRLGVFGFLAHPDLTAESPQRVSGNYGLLDQIAALRWVKGNIASFGGDAAKVTIAGESAGGVSVVDLLASPLARGLFARAIAESAGMGSIPELKREAYGRPSAQESGVRFAAATGAKGIADLRAMDPATLMTAALKNGFEPSATVDGRVLTRQIIDTFDRGEQARVPVLTGFNSGEVRTLRRVLPPPPADAAQYEAAIRSRYGELADRFLSLYPATDIDESMLAAVRDALFGWTSQRLVKSQTALGVPAYLYFFDHSYPAAEQDGKHGFHESEVPFVFGTIDRTTPAWPQVPNTPEEWKLSNAMTDYWAGFVKTGQPVAAGQPAWPAYGRGAAYLRFTDAPRSAANLLADRFRLIEEVVCRRHAAGNVPWGANFGVASPPLPAPAGRCR